MANHGVQQSRRRPKSYQKAKSEQSVRYIHVIREFVSGESRLCVVVHRSTHRLYGKSPVCYVLLPLVYMYHSINSWSIADVLNFIRCIGPPNGRQEREICRYYASYAVMLLILFNGKPRPQHSKVPSVGKPSHQTLLRRVLLFVCFFFFFAYFFTIHLKGLGTRLA